MSVKKKQGLINYYRKPFLIINAIIFFYLWIFTEGFLVVKEPYFDLIEGFGCILMFAGVLGRIFASLTISGRKNTEVINTEIYSTVRHPLYFFSFLLVIGASLIIGRGDLFLYLVFIFISCFYPMIINEQNYLEKLFGDKYTEYKSRTPFFIPNFFLYKAREKILIQTDLVVKTMWDAFLALLLIPAIEIIEFIKIILAQ